MSFPCLRCSDLSHCLVEVFGNWEAATTKNQKTLQGHWWAHTYATTFPAPSSRFLFFGIILGNCLKPGQFLVYHAETPWGDESRAISEQTASVHGFFGHLYWSAAESMPVQCLPTVQKNPSVKLQRCWFSGPLYSFCSYYFSGVQVAFEVPINFSTCPKRWATQRTTASPTSGATASGGNQAGNRTSASQWITSKRTSSWYSFLFIPYVFGVCQGCWQNTCRAYNLLQCLAAVENLHEISTRDIPFYVPAMPNVESKNPWRFRSFAEHFQFNWFYIIFFSRSWCFSTRTPKNLRISTCTQSCAVHCWNTMLRSGVIAKCIGGQEKGALFTVIWWLSSLIVLTGANCIYQSSLSTAFPKDQPTKLTTESWICLVFHTFLHAP